jgi:hypothetical protein
MAKKIIVDKADKVKESTKGMKISIQKYLQLYASEIHLYTRAYLGEQFRGIMKEKEAWKEEINKVMEGEKC